MSYKMTYHEEADGQVVLRYSGDVQGLVDACATEARGRREEGTPKKDMRRMMAHDPVVLMTIAHEHGIKDYFDPRVFEIAAGRDYSKFRTTEDTLYYKTRARKAGKIITLGVEKKDPSRKLVVP